MKTFLFFLLSSFSSILLQASTFTEANEAYQNKDYPQAIKLYQESLQDSQSLEQHYNLANAYYENMEYPLSVLHYQKALLFSPNNPDILQNLQLAYEALHLKNPSHSILDSYLNILSPYTWSWIYIFALSLAFLLFILSLYKRKIWIRFPLWICIFLVILSLGLHIFYYNKLNSGIVLSDNAALRVSATSTSPLITQLPQGSSIKVLKTKHQLPQWSFIRSGNKQEGWMNNEDFGLIW